jgi:TsgA-like MFS transporter
MSGMLAPMGIISGPMADHFGQDIAEITSRFSWLTMGVLGGAIAALVIFDWVGLKRMMILVYGVTAVCLASLYMADDLQLVGISLGLVGICCGIGLPGAALVISRSYDAERRASMLVITDGAFSFSGIVCSWLAISLVARELHWSGTYQFVAVVCALIIVLCAASVLPKSDVETAGDTSRESWPKGVWFCLAGLFLYTLGQWSFLLWLPNYAETRLQVPRDQAGQLVSQFWAGMFAAQIFVAWWVIRIGVPRLVLIATFSTFLFSLPLWLHAGIDGLIVLATVWGFANLGLLKIVLSFATQMVRVPTARLISSLLLGATVGTAVSPWITSRIVVATSNYFILQFGSACYIAMTVLLMLASRDYAANSGRAESGQEPA